LQASQASGIAPAWNAPSGDALVSAWQVKRGKRPVRVTSLAKLGGAVRRLPYKPHGKWFAGLAMALVVGTAMWVISPLEAAPIADTQAAVVDEYRSQMIMPLALGSESGRHMGVTGLVRPLADTPERPQEEVLATYRAGDTLDAVLLRAGLGRQQADIVAGMVERIIPDSEIAPGTSFAITLGQRSEGADHRPLEALEFRARFDMAIDIARHGDSFSLRREAIRVDETPLRIRGTVGDGLYRAAREAGAPADAVQDYLKALRAHVDIGSIGADDTFDIIVAHRRAATGERQAGKLLYAGLERGGSTRVQLMQWGTKGEFFDPRGLGQERGGYTQPVAARLSSGFGMRVHPILRYKRMHAGVDYAASYGTPIRAVSDGRVIAAGRMGGCGIGVRVSHGGDLSSRSCHMSRMAVRGGQRVTRGQVIGYVGSTGLSTGAHLHFELYRGGRPVNPLSVKFVTRDTLSKEELARFRDRLRRLTTVAPGAALEPLQAPMETTVAPAREIDRLVEARKVV
jgi:murein DD-endopeptidase MepM/ murein hydrolase activator NlpD